ncbi:1774_t:CDS:1, partial [Cetraspora pellucida]
SKKHVPCKVCDKPTSSAPETCKIYAGEFYVLQFYSHQLSKITASYLLSYNNLSSCSVISALYADFYQSQKLNKLAIM